MTPFALHDLHDRAAERDPDGVAFVERAVGGDVGEPTRTTRAAAVAGIAAVAGALRSLGVERGDRVAVRWPTSTDAHLGVAAVLRLGAVAVLVDPRASAARTDAVARTTGARVLVTDRLLHDDGLPAIAGRHRTAAAEVMTWSDARASDPAAPVAVLGDDPAYVLTTSGSTGEPKAIVHTHRSGLRYAELAAATYGLATADVVAHVPPLHFDQSTFALFAAPLAGAAVAPVPDVALRLPAELPGWISGIRPTVWYSVPTILTMLADRADPTTEDLSSLRWVLFGGEVPSHRVLRELMARTPDAIWSNVYGPAETNHCAHHHFDTVPAGEDLPFGRAWADTELRLVDDDGSVLRGPATGELQIRSATTMAGYWSRPDLDATAFVDELGPSGHVLRWYRTGDLVERDADGAHWFRGRRDRQVKIRGVRVELEAVEHAVAEATGATAVAAVTVRDGDGLDAVAVVVVGGDLSDEHALRRRLTERLPAAAVPARFVAAPNLPRTGSGKIDVRGAAALVAGDD